MQTLSVSKIYSIWLWKNWSQIWHWTRRRFAIYVN